MNSENDLTLTPTEPKKDYKPFQGFRKVYHVLASSFFPLFYLFPPFHLPFPQSRRLLLLVAGLSFLTGFSLDMLRLFHREFNSKFMKWFSILIRQTEENRFNGSTFLCFAFFIVILFFPRKVAIAAMLFLSLGDAAAELGGKNFGRLKIFQRSFEGTAAFFIVAFLTAFVLFEDWRIAVVGALAGALVELFSFEVDDNLTVPIGSALALWLVLAVLHSGPISSF
jgi:acyl phosphate:glycerol-3-phosphate acyltransferase